MNQIEFLKKLEEELLKNKITCTQDILSDYKEHFFQV